MADAARARRLAKRIAAIVASAIEYEIKDPGLAGVTITDAKVTADLHDATVYYTVMGRTLHDEPNCAGAAAALERAKGAAHQGRGGHRRSVHSHLDVHARHDLGQCAPDGRVAGPRSRRGCRSGAGRVGAKPAGRPTRTVITGRWRNHRLPGTGYQNERRTRGCGGTAHLRGDTGDDDRPKE